MIDGALGPGGRDLSVMIPTFNCAGYLGAALASLRHQGLDHAQVEVVDDASSDDPESEVGRVRWRQVDFHRHDHIGMVANFNACIARAQRPWVHILHGDDMVLPGAYARFDDLLGRLPHCRAAFGRVVIVDEQDRWRATSPLLGDGRDGELVYSTPQWGTTPVQFAGIIFQRAAAEAVGGFDRSRSHTADWDLWWRLTRRFPVAYSNHCLGAYRQFDGNDTAKLRRDAANLRQSLEQLNHIAATDGRHDRAVYWPLFQDSLIQARRFAGNRVALWAHLRLLASFPPVVPRTRAVARLLLSQVTERPPPARQ